MSKIGRIASALAAMGPGLVFRGEGYYATEEVTACSSSECPQAIFSGQINPSRELMCSQIVQTTSSTCRGDAVARWILRCRGRKRGAPLPLCYIMVDVGPLMARSEVGEDLVLWSSIGSSGSKERRS